MKMLRTIYSALLLFLAINCFGQNGSVPSAIQTPADSSKLILHVYAKGIQAYTCSPDPKNASHYVWTLKGPRADLYTDSAYSKRVGKHYFNGDKKAVWEDMDGSVITGAKLRQANAPDGVSIPWLLVKKLAAKGPGVLTPVVFVQRVQTKGGSAPSVAGAQDNGRTVEIAYTAEYFFYGEN
jgi:hypothetical protein